MAKNTKLTFPWITKKVDIYNPLWLPFLNWWKNVQNLVINKVLSFVSRCGHVWCRSRRFACILLVFFTRWGQLVTRHLIKHRMLCCVNHSCWKPTNHSRASCFIRWRVTSRAHRLKKTSSIQSKRRDLHPKWPHRETNDNTFLLLYFTTMNNHKLFYETWLL